MERTITQRELRNDNAEIMRALETGETFIITRNGVPVGRLTPIVRRTFAAGRKPRGGRAVDLFIAATALSRGLRLFTRNSADFLTVASLVEVVTV